MQRQHFLLGSFKTTSDGPVGVELTTSWAWNHDNPMLNSEFNVFCEIARLYSYLKTSKTNLKYIFKVESL